MYKLNNILINNYGLTPGRAPGSSIAIAGFMDLPKRNGKVYHDWGEVAGVEPYTAVTDHKLYDKGRVIFYGYVRSTTRTNVVKRIEELYHTLAAQEYHTLSTPWGTFTQLYVKEKIEVDWLGPSAAKLKLVFDGYELPLAYVALPIPAETGLHHIDNRSFVDFGAFVEKVENNFDRPDTKEAFSSNYLHPHQVTKPGYKEFKLSLLFYATDYEALKANIKAFYIALMFFPGTRIMNVDGLERECFNIEGVQVQQLQISAGQAICKLTLEMALAFDGVPQEPLYLLDEENTAIANNAGKLIQVQKPNVQPLANNNGQELRTNNFETITT